MILTFIVDGCIHRAAGKELYNYCRKLGGCLVGQAKITPGFKLPAKYVLHTVGPIGEDAVLLNNCYNSCLNLAVKNNVRTLAFCCISTGIYGYPNRQAANVALRTVRMWLEVPGNANKIDLIVFCTFLDKDKVIYNELIPKYFPK